MNVYQACEEAYKNGYEAGKLSKTPSTAEINTRVEVAYEQLSSCHTKLCKTSSRGENDELIYSLQEAMNRLLDIQVKLGVLKGEEDIK